MGVILVCFLFVLVCFYNKTTFGIHQHTKNTHYPIVVCVAVCVCVCGGWGDIVAHTNELIYLFIYFFFFYKTHRKRQRLMSQRAKTTFFRTSKIIEETKLLGLREMCNRLTTNKKVSTGFPRLLPHPASLRLLVLFFFFVSSFFCLSSIFDFFLKTGGKKKKKKKKKKGKCDALTYVANILQEVGSILSSIHRLLNHARDSTRITARASVMASTDLRVKKKKINK